MHVDIGEPINFLLLAKEKRSYLIILYHCTFTARCKGPTTPITAIYIRLRTTPSQFRKPSLVFRTPYHCFLSFVSSKMCRSLAGLAAGNKKILIPSRLEALFRAVRVSWIQSDFVLEPGLLRRLLSDSMVLPALSLLSFGLPPNRTLACFQLPATPRMLIPVLTLD